MNLEPLEWVTAIGIPALTVLVTYLGVRQSGRKTRTDAAQNLFNEVQEERAELKTERTELKKELADLRTELAEVKAADRRRDERERIRDDYIQELRNHIRRRLDPPPPPWPEGLINA